RRSSRRLARRNVLDMQCWLRMAGCKPAGLKCFLAGYRGTAAPVLATTLLGGSDGALQRAGLIRMSSKPSPVESATHLAATAAPQIEAASHQVWQPNPAFRSSADTL